MDRIFCIQRSWHDNIHFPDASILDWVFKRWCPYYLDKWQIVDDDISPQLYIDDHFAIPIGSIQFVQKWLKELNAIDDHMTPLEIPSCLNTFSGRIYFQCKGRDIPKDCLNTSKWFIKDISDLKTWNSLLYDDMDVSYYIEPEKKYSVSEKLEFESEHRLFVYDGQVIGSMCYAGDPLVYPYDIPPGFLIEWYEKQSIAHPKSYTFDIGIAKSQYIESPGKTVPLEIHPFVACGLYGFHERELLDMYEAGYRWYLEEYVEDVFPESVPHILSNTTT